MSEKSENVVVCPDESSARAEAAQREALDPERDRYYWHDVCLEGQWDREALPPRGGQATGGGRAAGSTSSSAGRGRLADPLR